MPQQSEIRKDPIVDKYVIIAPQRSKRPHQIVDEPAATHVDQATCVFCPQNIDRVKSLYHAGSEKRTWKVKVVRNVFPAVSLDNPKAYGTQEVVIETPHHKKNLEDLPTSHVEEIFIAYAHRTKAISKIKNIEYVMIFKNSGGTAGASIEHAHSQIFATNFIPPHLIQRSQKAKEHLMRTGRCAYCDMIAFEEKSRRLIYRDRLVSVFAPFASQNNYEVWILPQRHIDNVTQLNPKERRAFAVQLKKVLKKITKLHLPYNYYFHQVVKDEDQHLYMKIRPRGSVWAGVEIGSGVIINAVPPEAAARYYRAR